MSLFYHNNRELALLAVSRDPLALTLLHSNLKSDPEMVDAAIDLDSLNGKTKDNNSEEFASEYSNTLIKSEFKQSLSDNPIVIDTDDLPF
jgi:hypothetical protein